MNDSLVSIITPAYYGEDTLERAIRSVLTQNYSNWEMIIISDDDRNYKEVVQQYGIEDDRLRFTSTGQVGSGASNARNKGLEMARGRYISCLDCDDAFKPHKLSTLLPFAKKYGVAISSIDYRDSETDDCLENLSAQPKVDYITPEQLFTVCFHSVSVYVCDRDKIDVCYDIDLPNMQDAIFLMSFFNTVDKIGYCHEPLHIYYRRDGSACNSHKTTQSFIFSKKKILEKLNAGTTTIKNHRARSATQKHIDLMLQMEDIYTREVAKDPSVSFLKLFKSYLEERSVWITR